MKPNGYVMVMWIGQQQATVHDISNQEQMLQEAGLFEPGYRRLRRWLRKGWKKQASYQSANVRVGCWTIRGRYGTC